MPTLRDQLLAWYDRHQRKLPWRVNDGEAADPYRVWVSEVMLQQTRVETALPYYERWMERFPTIDHLAVAPLDEVLKHWEGLGYYSRARNLHRAVREVRDQYGSRVPDDLASFRALPGVGRYTAGAVMSIVFGQEEPLVDGNVRRVLARMTDEPYPKDAILWELAADLVPGERPGDLNQALMELGATVCTRRSPRCEVCPISQHCDAHAMGTAEQRPAPRQRKAIPLEDEAVAIVRRAGKYLLTKRPAVGRLAGMWNFPSVKIEPAEAVESAASRAVRQLLNVEPSYCTEIDSFTQTFTHVKVAYHVVECGAVRGETDTSADLEFAWVNPDEFERFTLPVAQKRIARSLTAESVHETYDPADLGE